MKKIGILFVTIIMTMLFVVSASAISEINNESITAVTITRKPSSTIKPGETFQLQVSVTPSNAINTNVTYKSQDTTVATVSSTGLISAIKDGQTVITVTSVANPNKSASFTLKVQYKPTPVEKITLKSSYTFYEGEIISLNPTFYPAEATDKGYTITGSDHSYSYKGGFIGIQNKTEVCKFSDYVYVTNTNLIKGIKATIEEKSDKAEKPSFSFNITVRATDGSGATATTTIKVLPRMIDVDYRGAEELPWYYGNSAKLSYSLHDSIESDYDASKIRFKSSDTSIATVTNEGVVNCKGVGDVTITAYTTDGKYSGTYEIYSRGIVEIEDTYIEKCKAGSTYQIKAKILPAGTSDNIIYYTSDSSSATVDKNGLVTFKAASGNVKILVGLSSDTFNLKEVWFTTGSFKAPSGTNAQLLNHMRNTVNALKTSQNLPSLTRYDATTFSDFTTSSNQITGSQLQSIFNSELTPKTTYLPDIYITSDNYIALRNQFLENVPVKSASHIIESTLTDGDIKSIQVIDNGDYYYEMKLTLKDETFNTLPTTPSATRHGKVFDILTKSYMDGILNKFDSTDQLSINYSSFKQKYHDCTVTVGINKINNSIEYANYDVNIDVDVTGLTFQLSGLSARMDVSFECNNTINLDFAGNNTQLGGHSHTFTNYISDGTASCTTIGYKTAKCDYCNLTDTIPEIKPHNFNLYSVTKYPSCTEEGEMAYLCSWCELKDESSVVKLEKLPHNFKNDWQIITLPTCTNTGISIRICIDCLITESKIEGAKNHTFNGSVCTDCGYNKADSCSCNCHKSGLSAILWKLLNFFYKLLRINETCACGTAHY